MIVSKVEHARHVKAQEIVRQFLVNQTALRMLPNSKGDILVGWRRPLVIQLPAKWEPIF